MQPEHPHKLMIDPMDRKRGSRLASYNNTRRAALCLVGIHVRANRPPQCLLLDPTTPSHISITLTHCLFKYCLSKPDLSFVYELEMIAHELMWGRLAHSHPWNSFFVHPQTNGYVELFLHLLFKHRNRGSRLPGASRFRRTLRLAGVDRVGKHPPR
ncbi:hypothetical protein MUK42_27876 [Musa troglodytarum]|uniref:Uncharacterized protein n=1 Tax=Musa troglodytarum TaxID=320322 RepID=A0A9E7GFL1_9LILI|nr:hypothetical protein MUK42_27876 [Musa troglodytarum]